MVQAPSTPGAPRRYERGLWIAIAVLTAAALTPVLTPGVVGFFHDDAIYASGAMSIAEGNGYRLANLPEAPYQTKYPPFFAFLLALVWWIRPEFPSNVLVLKGLNLAFAAVAGLAVASLAREQLRQASPWIPALCLVAVVTNPSMVGLANYTMTDVLFATLVVVILRLWGRGEPVGPWRELAAVALVSSAILTRSIGIALAAAMVVDCLWRRRPVRAALYAVVAFSVAAGWTLWAAERRQGHFLIIDYYQTYERPAFAYLPTDPSLAFDIVAGNIRLAVETAPLVVGPLWGLVWPAALVLMAAGAWRLARDGWRMPLLFFGCYVALILMHPWSPSRYLLPLVPIIVLTMLQGATEIWSAVGRLRAPVLRPVSAPALVVLWILVLGNLVWLNFRLRPGDNIRGWNGTDSGYLWSGFEDTFAWISRHTPPEARLGGLFDTMYFLYTGRQSVRPWFHRPETYFYPYGAARPFVGRPEDVARELRMLRIDYVVLDPPAGRFEGEAAMSLLRDVMALPEVRGELVFRSRDGLHEVYRLWNGTHPSGQQRSSQRKQARQDGAISASS